jgi:hypothetical protein
MAVIALLDMPAQSSRAAGDDRPQDATLLWTYSLKPMLMASYDLCQFQRWARALEQVRHDIGVWRVGLSVGCG